MYEKKYVKYIYVLHDFCALSMHTILRIVAHNLRDSIFLCNPNALYIERKGWSIVVIYLQLKHTRLFF